MRPFRGSNKDENLPTGRKIATRILIIVVENGSLFVSEPIADTP